MKLLLPKRQVGSAYLRSALLAVIAHFKGDAKRPFKDQPKEIREAFFNGVTAQIKFRQGLYTYKGPWKGALPWLRERMEEPPSEKVRLRLEEMVSPVICAIAGPALARRFARGAGGRRGIATTRT
jgi:excinuclease UvrABC ATPase subunit